MGSPQCEEEKKQLLLLTPTATVLGGGGVPMIASPDRSNRVSIGPSGSCCCCCTRLCCCTWCPCTLHGNPIEVNSWQRSFVLFFVLYSQRCWVTQRTSCGSSVSLAEMWVGVCVAVYRQQGVDTYPAQLRSIVPDWHSLPNQSSSSLIEHNDPVLVCGCCS